MKKATIFNIRQFLPVLALLFCQVAIILQSCQKSIDASGEKGSARSGEVAGKKKPPNPPPPPPPFYFTNCNNPTFSASFPKGAPANVSITKNYVNSPGGSYAAFTSATVNGITISAPAGTFNAGSGSVVFTATGTPINTGVYSVWISVGNIQPCMMYFSVTIPPPDPATCGGEPGAAVGSTGCVTFTYQGQTVTYSTVRAKDGKVWLQQNLGSPQVAMSDWDQASFGHFFQWGRWDDGHQLRNSPMISGNASLQNPSHIPNGNPNFITGYGTGIAWWSMGLASDTWSGTTVSSTNGKSPCAVLGAGWRLPTLADWQNVVAHEGITSQLDAFSSNLKLPGSAYRGFEPNGGGLYWSSTAANNGNAAALQYDNSNYFVWFDPTWRSAGGSCRCVKD